MTWWENYKKTWLEELQRLGLTEKQALYLFQDKKMMDYFFEVCLHIERLSELKEIKKVITSEKNKEKTETITKEHNLTLDQITDIIYRMKT